MQRGRRVQRQDSLHRINVEGRLYFCWGGEGEVGLGVEAAGLVYGRNVQKILVFVAVRNGIRIDVD